MPRQDEIAVFCAVAETGGFTAAARRLEVTKSAVSKAIARLETDLEARLFHRTTRRISLTEAGEAYYAHARRAMLETDAARDAVASLTREPQGRVRVSAPMSFGLARLAQIVPQFLNRYPRMAVDLHLDDARVDLVAGGYDLAIRIGEMPDSALVARRIGTMASVLVGAPQYLASQPAPVTPTDLEQHQCVLFSYATDPDEWLFTHAGRTERIRVRGRYRVNSSIALRLAVLAGVGIGRIPRYLVADDIAAGRLVSLLPDYDLPGAPISAVFPQRTYIARKARLFADFVATCLDDNGAAPEVHNTPA